MSPDPSASTDLTRRTAAELSELLAKGEVSAVEVTQAHLDRIAAVDGPGSGSADGGTGSGIHAFLHVAGEVAVANAGVVDHLRSSGEKLPPLAGVPIAVKDVMTTRGMPTTAGSRILEGWMPPYDATVVRRLRENHLVLLGKTNMDEFAMGSSTEHSAYGPTHNPWDLDRIPGGSGGGSAAALASFQAPLATGTDTGGSIRQPAAVTGTVGVKPTYGGVSRYGLIALASSLDQAGPCARTVLDAALLHEVMAGHDPMDSTSLPDAVPAVVRAAREGARDGIAGLRIGVVSELNGEGYQAGVRARFDESLALLTEAGAELVEVSCPSFATALAAYYLILPSEASSNLAKFDAMRYGLRVGPPGIKDPSAELVMSASREAGFGDEVKRRILIGTYALSSGYYDAYYVRAQKARTLIAGDFAKAFASCDAIACPAAATPAFAFAAKTDPVSMYLMDYYTIPMSLAGLPSLSVPCGYVTPVGGASPMPLGLELSAPLFAERSLLGIAHAYERGTRHAEARSIPDLPRTAVAR